MAKIPEEVLLGMIANAGGSGGTSDYSQLTNQPQINGTTLIGNKSASDLSLASLDANGKVPSSQLPSYVDDVVEGYYDALTDRFYEESTFETVIAPVEGKSWVDIPANKSYRWTGSVYVRVDEGVQIGETSDTAYAGNKGKANADAIAAIKDGQTINSFGDVETALAGKQGTITAGTYIQKSGDTISVKRDISQEVDEVLTLTHDTSSGTHKVNAVLTVAGETIDSETFTTDGGTFHDMVQIYFNPRAVRFMFTYLIASKTHSTGYEDYIYNEYTDTFVETIGEGYKLIIKSEMDTALSGKQDTLTFDSVPTDGSTNPVESNGVYDALASKANTSDVTTALATKQDATDNTLETTDKTVSGAINEVNSGVETLQDWTDADTKSVTGNPITISDAAAVKAKALSMSIVPDQDLHGFDHPWVGGAGDNKLDVSGVSAFPVDSDGYVSAQNTESDTRAWSYANSQYKFTLPAGNWKVVAIVKTASTVSSNEFKLYVSDGTTLLSEAGAFGEVGTKSYNFTISEETQLGLMAKLYDGVTRLMILPQSVTSNDWQPYENICPISGLTSAEVETTDGDTTHTATIAFGQTVYGGEVDFETGKVRVTHGFGHANDFAWGDNGATATIYQAKTTQIQKANGQYNIITDKLSNQSGNYRIAGRDDSSLVTINVPISIASDITEFNTWIATENIEVCYELATPIELQLTPAQLELLKGNNTITANGATISLTYQQGNLIGEVMEQVQPQLNELAGKQPVKGTFTVECSVGQNEFNVATDTPYAGSFPSVPKNCLFTVIGRSSQLNSPNTVEASTGAIIVNSVSAQRLTILWLDVANISE